MNLDPQHIQALFQVISQDPTLTTEQRVQVMEKLDDQHFLSKSTKAGVVGGSVGYAVSKFLALPKRAQILLTLAGFGIGKYLLVKSQNYDKFMRYNEKLEMYEIKENK